MSETNDLGTIVTSLVEDGGWSAPPWDARRGEHPQDEIVARYVSGDLDEAAAAPLRDHLATCRECAAIVVDLVALPDLPAVPGEPGDRESAAAWAALRKRLAAERSPAVAAAPPAPVPLWRRPALGWVAAAAMLVVSVVGGSWTAHLDERLRELQAPQPNVPLVDLDANASRGAGADETTVMARGSYYLLIFYPPVGEDGGDPSDTYSWTLTDAAGHQVLAGDGLRLQNGDYMTLLVHRAGLEAGSYRLRVFARSASGTTPLGEQGFHLTAGG